MCIFAPTKEIITAKRLNMRFLRNLLALVVLLLSTQVALADNYAFLNISDNNGETSFELNQISRITFDASNMVVHLSDGSQQQLPLIGLKRMFFSETGTQNTTSIAFLGQKINVGDGQLRLQLDEGERAMVYNMKGSLVYTTNHSGTLQLDNMPKGVYIIRVGNVTKKIMTK